MAFLQHDMAPVEPSATYQPSQGAPKRDNKLKGHALLDPSGTCFMHDAPARVAMQEKVNNPPARRPRHVEQPGTAKVAHEFFEGKHSRNYSREPTGGLKAMFDNPDRLRERAKQDRDLNRQYSKANSQVLKQRQRQREEERKYDIIRSKSHLTTDPWEKNRPRVKPNARVPRYNDVTKGRVFNQEAMSQSYTSLNFGGGGSGAPRKDANGNILAHRSHTVSSMRDFERGESELGKGFGKREATNPRLRAAVSKNVIHNDSKGDTYNDRVFGKEGVAGRPRQTASGKITAHHTRMLETERHHLDVPGDAYNDKVFKQKAPVTVVNGEVRASRRTLQTQLGETHRAGAGGLADKMEQSRKARADGALKMSRDEEFKGRFTHPAPLSTSIHK